MRKGMRLLRFDGDQSMTPMKGASPQARLDHFQDVTNGVMQDALNVWADLWGELQSGVVRGAGIASEAEKPFRPSCGWPEFLEKMWLLRNHLDFMVRFSRQSR
jgi:hypothetical protein